jgi:hypothetical protein
VDVHDKEAVLKYLGTAALCLFSTMVQSNDLCMTEEQRVAGCELRNGKSVSFCKASDGITTYRYGSVKKLELEIAEQKPGSMLTLSESYSKGAAQEYQAQNGSYQYTFLDTLYGDMEAVYLLSEMEHRGYDVPWISESTLAHHAVDKHLTVSHSSKGELARLYCQDDDHFYGPPHNQAQYIHILRDTTDKYRTTVPAEIAECQSESKRCFNIYEDYKQEFAVLYFPVIGNSAFVNNTAYLIKMSSGAMVKLAPEIVDIQNQAQSKGSGTIHLTLDNQQTVIGLETK